MTGPAMPLTLITGPANAAKAGAVLERLRAALHARARCWSCRRSADAAHYAARAGRRRGSCSAPRCSTFPRLMREHRAAVPECARGRSARSRATRRGARPRSPSAGCACWRRRRAAPGLRGGARATLFAELQRSLVGPARFDARGAGVGPDAPPTPTSSPRSTRPTSRGSRRSARSTRGLARAALDALRAAPAAWDGRPVFLYGFDELTRAQLDAVETLARAATPTSASR